VHNAVSRAGAFSIVVLLHVAVLTVSWQRPAPERKEQRALTWVDIEALPEVKPAESERSAPARERDRTVRPSRRRAVEPASPTIPAPSIDWRATMEAAANSAAEKIIREEGYRALGPTERGASESSVPGSIFERPRRQAGDIDQEPGRALIWHNERCYTELKFPTIKDPNAIVGAPNPPKCMYPIGSRRPRSNLFDDLKEK
jgi:hypothetical protein